MREKSNALGHVLSIINVTIVVQIKKLSGLSFDLNVSSNECSNCPQISKSLTGIYTQPTFTFPKLIMKTLIQGVKYVK